MTEVETLISLNLVADIGSTQLKKLLNYFHKPQNILNASEGKLMAVSGIGEKAASRIRSFKKEDLDKELALAKKYNLKILTLDDPEYPENLTQIPDPPIVIYAKGRFSKQDKLSLAVVGSRRASFYGLSCAEKFSGDLSRLGITIISGMARGTDTAAHRGALKAKGRTIAVMGSGFSYIYPPENVKLAQEISLCGAVISEFPCETEPLGRNFPRRNRIISGLSLGVLVIEAALNSGALITADFALEQGREVFSLPGKVDSRNSFGTHALIKQGAKLVSCLEDILEELNLDMIIPQQPGQDKELVGIPKLSPEAAALYGLISEVPKSLEEILVKVKLTPSVAMKELLSLEIRHLIRQVPGRQFVRYH